MEGGYDRHEMDVPSRALFRRFPALALPIVPLLDGPSPVHRMPTLEEETGAAGFFIKDDGRASPPYGGNKPRKLEWLLGDARARGFEEVLAIGADGSNYCLAAAVHGTRAGFAVTLVTMPQPPSPGVRRNLLAGAATGAEYLPAGGDLALLVRATARVVAGALRGRRPYATWFGGSSPLGSIGFVEAALELVEQIEAGALPTPDVVFVPTGSVGSHAGLLAGMHLAGLRTRVVGVRVTPKIMGNARLVAATANGALHLLRKNGLDIPGRIHRADVIVREGFFGSGYGHPTPEGDSAIARARDLGISLDPTYSAKTFAAALTADTAGRNVLFWNTHNAFPVDELPSGAPSDLPAVIRRRTLLDQA